MKGRIIVFNGTNQIAYLNLGIQLFPDLSFQCLLRGFARLDFAAREFPVAGIGLALRAGTEQHPAVFTNQNADGHVDDGLSHGVSP